MTPQREQPDWGDMPDTSSEPAQPVPPNRYAGYSGPHRPAQNPVQPRQQDQPYRAQAYPEQYPAHHQQSGYQQGQYAATYEHQDPSLQKNIGGKRKKLIAGLAAAGAVLVLGGGSAAAYYGYVLPNKPNNILMISMARTFDNESLKSFRYDGVAEVSGGDIPTEVRGLSFAGEFSDTGASNSTVTLETAFAKPKLSILSADSKSFYAKISGIDGIENLISMFAAGSEYESIAQQLTPALAELNDQWYEIDSSMLNEMGTEATGEPLPTEISKEDFSKLADAYQQNQFLSVIETLPDQDINGSPAKHFKVQVQKTELIGFIKTVKNLNISGIKLTDTDITEAEAQVNKTDFAKYPFEVWIDKKTKFLAQSQIAVSEQGTNATMRFTLKDYNAAVNVTKPENAKSLMELMGQVAPQISAIEEMGSLGSMGGGSAYGEADISLAGGDAQAELTAMRFALESYYSEANGYPTAKDFADPAWRSTNLPSVTTEQATDAKGVPINGGGDYTYETTGSPAACVSPTTANGQPAATGKFCDKFVLTAKSPDGEDYVINSLN